MANQFLILCSLAVLVHSALSCTYQGKDFKIGEKFPAVDGCNECVCGAIGVLCTKMMCSFKTTVPAGKSCTVDVAGVPTTYPNGQSYKSPDGCNTCVCQDGMPICTLMACIKDTTCTDPATGKTYAPGSSFKSSDGCNTCNCFNGIISCTEMACMNTGVCFDDSTGQTYKTGETFEAPDGCNTCSCQKTVISCTKIAC
ncbi:kielin/chordin-like protein [Aplysia californica]|uniref:Kielin/chordin-like protein n=1 Tax=Aplysia californica TaxID=6500 RepID=A0ABM1A271_APLCA|nr:kielin/chordin-like protein [Aplysia californica]